MRSISTFSLTILLVAILTINLFSTNHYVDKNATGLNNGSSWADAWESFADINWTSVQPGDSVFISGGSDSTIYNEILDLNLSGTSGNYAVITKGKTTGHDGQVIIDGQGFLAYNINFNSSQYIKVEKLFLKNATSRNIRLRSSNNIVSECNFYISSGATCGIDVRASNCIIENNIGTTSATLNDGQLDFTQITSGGNHIVRYNHITLSNIEPNAHCDGIQTYGIPNGRLEVYGNIIILDNEKRSNSQGMYIAEIGGIVKVYNNIIFNKSDINVNGLITISETTSEYDLDTVMVYNNSIYTAGFGNGIHVKTNQSNTPGYTSIYNNSIRMDAKGRNEYPNSSAIIIKLNLAETPIVDYNITYQDDPSRLSTWSYNGDSRTFAEWQSLGFDVTGLNEVPGYTSITEGSFDLNPLPSSNLIDAGLKLHSSFGTDYNKDVMEINRNLSGLWDVGAYESGHISGLNDLKEIPSKYVLEQNFPNPFNPNTTIKFVIPETQLVTISVFNILGEFIAELISKEYIAGEHSITFNAANLVSGVYIYSIQTPYFVDSKKMVVMK